MESRNDDSAPRDSPLAVDDDNKAIWRAELVAFFGRVSGSVGDPLARDF